jgi:hypothetical protein
MGESANPTLTLCFDRRLRLEFRGVTSDKSGAGDSQGPGDHHRVLPHPGRGGDPEHCYWGPAHGRPLNPVAATPFQTGVEALWLNG